MNLLEQLKKHTKVVADTGPSLIFAASQNPKYAPLIDDAIAHAKKESNNKVVQLDKAMDKLAVNFGLKILEIVPNRVSTEVDARLSFDREGSLAKAHELIGKELKLPKN